MDDLEGYEFVVLSGAAGDEEERCISAIDYLLVYLARKLSARVIQIAGEEDGGKGMDRPVDAVRTFVLEEVAHACPPGKDELGDILDNLRLILRGKRGEPFGEALRPGQPSFVVSGGIRVCSARTTLPCLDSRIRYLCHRQPCRNVILAGNEFLLNRHGDVWEWLWVERAK